MRRLRVQLTVLLALRGWGCGPGGRPCSWGPGTRPGARAGRGVRRVRRLSRPWVDLSPLADREQILTNLVGNAIKYSPGGGEVLVTVEHDGDTVLVSVRDQGIGMSPRDMGQLFEKFGSVFTFTLPTSDELAGSGR